MLKKIFKLLMVLASIILISAPAFAEKKPPDNILSEGDKKLNITYQKDAHGGVVDVIVDGDFDADWTTHELYLKVVDKKNPENFKEYKFKHVAIEAIVTSEKNSPGCTWYFFMNRWWRICQ